MEKHERDESNETHSWPITSEETRRERSIGEKVRGRSCSGPSKSNSKTQQNVYGAIYIYVCLTIALAIQERQKKSTKTETEHDRRKRERR